MKIYVLNGPNLGRLGSREPEVYGSATHAELVRECLAAGERCGVEVEVRQSDDEAELIGWIHEAIDVASPIVINPAAFTHYSYALRDACAMSTKPVLEVHLSNPSAREEFRHNSVISGVASGVISGLGLAGYRLAIEYLAGQ
jgi:3-dehydroquinate dehydratase II